MKILALDTATEACSAAIYVDSEISEKSLIAPRRHADLILSMIDELLNESGVTLSALDAIAFGRGPGAFTGIRIAAGIVQGLAYGADLPVIPVSTLAALAQGTKVNSEFIISAIDARMGEIYTAIYKRDNSGLVIAITDESVMKADNLSITGEGTYYGVGTGWATYHDVISVKFGNKLIGYNGECYPQSRDILLLAIREYEMGNLVKPEEAIPVYIRNKVTS
ncbi:MAG: tRNA threonylcarbamoyladenosine biosynthesis protein TsaB [Gammaproteobacteria bacterium]